jgi:hypothetical protein
LYRRCFGYTPGSHTPGGRTHDDPVSGPPSEGDRGGRRQIDWIAAEESPEFRELVKKRRRFVIPATIFARPIPLANRGIISIPLGFLGCVLGTLLAPERGAERSFDELYVRSETGLGAEATPGAAAVGARGAAVVTATQAAIK